jgi:type IV pilus biogenesis protein CpaD/CtpE
MMENSLSMTVGRKTRAILAVVPTLLLLSCASMDPALTAVAIPAYPKKDAPTLCKSFAKTYSDGIVDSAMDQDFDDGYGAIGAALGAGYREASVRKELYRRCVAAAVEGDNAL